MEASWREVEFEQGVSPWQGWRGVESLYSSTRTPRPSPGPHDYDKLYEVSEALEKDGASIRDAVSALLGRTPPGTLVEARFRLCSGPGQLYSDVDEAVHDVPQLEAFADVPSVELAKELRPDQREALGFLARREKTPEFLKVALRGFVRMAPPPLVVGGQARFSPSARPFEGTVVSTGRWRSLTVDDVTAVLRAPGEVTEISS